MKSMVTRKRYFEWNSTPFYKDVKDSTNYESQGPERVSLYKRDLNHYMFLLYNYMAEVQYILEWKQFE